ncbi:MAG: hypothetical protein QXS96_08160 [Candidatus Caldarchaeum sp.]
MKAFPDPIRGYLRQSERLGLPQRPLIAQRKSWYKMEVRLPPPFLFAYLGRRNSRFIRNVAKVVPLTSFLCLYPRGCGEQYLEKIWKILNHHETMTNLSKIGKTYGDGAIKVEPRLLKKFRIPDNIIEQFGFPVQKRLFERGEPDTTQTGRDGSDEGG